MSDLEATLDFQLRALRLTGYQREYRFDKSRKWRADFAFPQARLLVEVEGGIHSGGRHVRGKGYEADLDKYNAAVAQGWAVLRFSPKHVQSGLAVGVIETYLKQWYRESEPA